MSSPTNNNDFKLENLFNVKDKVVVISGGGSGIGLMATQAFAVNGAKVYIIGRTKEKLDKVAELYGKDVPVLDPFPTFAPKRLTPSRAKSSRWSGTSRAKTRSPKCTKRSKAKRSACAC